VAVPPWRVSTARAFRALDRSRYGLTRPKAKLRFGKVTGRTALEPRDVVRLGNSFEDVLGARRSDFIGLCSRMREAGLLEPRMTGSGSAVFGLLGRRSSARAVLDRLAGGEALYVVRSARRGLDIDRLR